MTRRRANRAPSSPSTTPDLLRLHSPERRRSGSSARGSAPRTSRSSEGTFPGSKAFWATSSWGRWWRSPPSEEEEEQEEEEEEKRSWIGARVVADINCRPRGSVPLSSLSENDENRILARNHEPGGSVLGIVDRDGAFAEFVSLPVANLHRVPRSLSDKAAAFAEPLAAALRVVEQAIIKENDSVAVIGDGRLGLLVAAALSVGARVGRGWAAGAGGPLREAPRLSGLVHFGRRPENMALVPRMTRGGGKHEIVVVPRGGGGGGGDECEDSTGGRATTFDVVVEASGSGSGIELALSLCRCLGTVVLKTTCAPPDVADPAAAAAAAGDKKKAVLWASVANDSVVNEKKLVGSRCGPVEDALAALEEHPELVALVEAMVRHEFSLEQGVEALGKAAEPGALKVQLVMM